MEAVFHIEDPALDRLLARVVEVMNPLEVWLFGSRAEGRARPDSDYDLLVVLPMTCRRVRSTRFVPGASAERRRRAHMAPRTIALELRIAHAMFSWARSENVVGDDAVLRIPRRKRPCCKEANVSRFSPQGLRRMVVNRLMRAKVDPGTAAQRPLTGHSVQVMLRYYRTVTDEDRRAAVEAAKLGVLDDDDEKLR